MNEQLEAEAPLERILEDCLKGNTAAQRLLFNKYKKLFYSLAYKSLGPKFDIEEVVHEIFIQMFRGLPSFQHKSRFDTWAYRIGINVCVSWLRKKFKKRRLDVIPETEITDSKILDKPDTPFDNLANLEIENKIYEALDQLDEKKRMVVVLHDMQDKTLEEIAEIIQKPVGTVKSRLFHGRNEMRFYLEKYLNE
jgi:RNA polymerase sigma-70 factor, ECF subfamily